MTRRGVPPPTDARPKERTVRSDLFAPQNQEQEAARPGLHLQNSTMLHLPRR